MKTEILLKDKDNVRAFPWTSFLDTGSDTVCPLVNDNLTTRASHSGNRAGGDPFQDTNQSADPDFDRDPARGQFNEQTRLPGTGGDRELRQAGYRDQVIGGPQERFEPPVNYGTSTGTGPGARPCDHDIRRDGGFGGKPSMPERMMGKLAPFLLFLYGTDFDHRFCLQVLPKRWSERLPAMLRCTNMARIARYVNPHVSTSLTYMTIFRAEGTKLWPRPYS